MGRKKKRAIDPHEEVSGALVYVEGLNDELRAARRSLAHARKLVRLSEWLHTRAVAGELGPWEEEVDHLQFQGGLGYDEAEALLRGTGLLEED